jgi:ATP-binding cassette, subfamily B, heavy metal transporter
MSLPKRAEESKGPAPIAPGVVKKKKYGLWDFTKFTVPYVWRGGFMIRFQTVLTVLMLLLSRGLNVTHPLILKFAIDEISGVDDNHGHTYMLITMYCVVRFLADFVNNIREIPFANVSASAEIYIAHLVYNHI